MILLTIFFIVTLLVRPFLAIFMIFLFPVHTFIFVVTILALVNLMTLVLIMVIAFRVLAFFTILSLLVAFLMVSRFIMATLGHFVLAIQLTFLLHIPIFVKFVEEFRSFFELILK